MGRLTVVLDASALLAVLGEQGAERVIPHLAEASISAINFSETMARAIDRGHPAAAVAELIEHFGIAVVPFVEADAVTTADLRRTTRAKGLSLADRACIALAQRMACPALTADRLWSEIELPVEVVQTR